MKLIQVFTILATTASASMIRACTDTDMDGSCSLQSTGMGMGSWKSYDWESSPDHCFKVCDGCVPVDSGCEDKANGNVTFDKFLIFSQAGEDRVSCC